jgi:HlyD family secretion protein
MATLPAPRTYGVRRHVITGMVAALVLVGGVGTLSGATVLAGAVIAHGTLAVSSNVKQVQHLDGGIVSEIKVREGDAVEAGDTLIRLDPVIARAGLAIIRADLDQNAARRARLVAERDGAAEIAFPQDMMTRAASDAAVADMLASEQRLFIARREARAGNVAQLRERGEQLRQEIDGLQAQLTAKLREITLIDQELDGTRKLWERQLMPIQRVTAIEREAARVGGERGSLLAAIARARAGIAETELQVLQIDQDLRSEVTRDIREAEGNLSALGEKRLASEETLRRLDIRAPQSGIVHELAVQTIGGVVPPGGVLMRIVPQDESLRIDARVSPDQVDQLFVGQDAVVSLSAFDRSTTPEVRAKVGLVSPNLTVDQKSGQSFYLVQLELLDGELDRLGDLKLIPGMPAECFIRTSDRTMLSYVTKPLMDQLNRSFRE